MSEEGPYTAPESGQPQGKIETTPTFQEIVTQETPNQGLLDILKDRKNRVQTSLPGISYGKLLKHPLVHSVHVAMDQLQIHHRPGPALKVFSEEIALLSQNAAQTQDEQLKETFLRRAGRFKQLHDSVVKDYGLPEEFFEKPDTPVLQETDMPTIPS